MTAEPPLFAAGEDLTAETRARPKRMIERLYRVFSRQLSDVETPGREDGAAADEKDARMLGTLARTLGTLMALDRDDGATAEEPEPVDPHEIRAKLAKRIISAIFLSESGERITRTLVARRASKTAEVPHSGGIHVRTPSYIVK